MSSHNKKLLAVNWENGVRITKDHFKDNDAFVMQSIQQSQRVNTTLYNFGILSKEPDSDSFPILSYNPVSDTEVEFSLSYCDAVNLNGERIFYSDKIYGESLKLVKDIRDISSSSSSSSFYIYLYNVADSYITTGAPRDASNPVHRPYLLPDLKLGATLGMFGVEAIHKFLIDGNFTIIARVNVNEEGFQLDPNYIPPVSRVSMSSQLERFKAKIIKSFLSLEQDCFNIHHKNRLKYKTSILAYHTSLLSNALLDFLANHSWGYREGCNYLSEQEPVVLLKPLFSLAKAIRFQLRLLSPQDNEYLLNYYHNWTQIKPRDFEQDLDNVINHVYYHTDIVRSVNVLNKFLDTIVTLWNNLSKLEYIGQQQDNLVTSEDPYSQSYSNESYQQQQSYDHINNQQQQQPSQQEEKKKKRSSGGFSLLR